MGTLQTVNHRREGPAFLRRSCDLGIPTSGYVFHSCWGFGPFCGARCGVVHSCGFRKDLGDEKDSHGFSDIGEQ